MSSSEFRDATSANERVMVYVDGLNLYHGMIASNLTRYLWLDVVALSANLIQRHQVLAGAKYFYGQFLSEVDGGGMFRRQDAHMQAIATRSGVELIEGEFQVRRRSCRNCGFEWRTYEEKMTDVNIGIEMVCDAEDGKFDTALLVSGDGDLASTVRKVISRHPTKRVVVAFPPKRQSNALAREATGHTVIGRTMLRNSQLPDNVTSRDGFTLRRPGEWT